MKTIVQHKRLRNPVSNLAAGLAILLATAISQGQTPDPRTNSWLTAYSGRYAQVYTNSAAQSAGTAATTWDNGSQAQTLPAYSGVQDVYSSSNWVYLRTTGLGAHVMGPWYLNAAHTQVFPNFPVNTKTLFRIPRNPTAPTSKTVNGLGPIGYFVDGVAMFNSWDAFYWNGSSDVSGGGGGYWNRDAYVNEGITFDPAYAHQPNDGTYHYHADPIALRYLLGDHVDYNASTKTYSESTNPPTNHSPILGWVSDGYPVYGPYGYASASNAASGVRRMISGYVPRNGQNGADNLSTNGAARSTIPAWAQRFYGATPAQSGPTVSSSYPFGRYMEDNAYLGDLTNPITGQAYQQGVDFDLDACNGRWCVTPEFPLGTYAYFVAISSNGTPVFPYNIGAAYNGNPAGGSVSSISETVVTNFAGGPDSAIRLNAPSRNAVTGDIVLTWSSVDGGSYRVDSSNDLVGWTNKAVNIPSQGLTTQITTNQDGNSGLYRVALTGLASYDPVTTAGVSGTDDGILSVTPTNGVRGTSVMVTFYLDPLASPALPPSAAPVNSAAIGTIAGSNCTHVSQTVVQASFTIPPDAATGPQTATVVFPGPPSNPSQTVTYTLANAFTIQ